MRFAFVTSSKNAKLGRLHVLEHFDAVKIGLTATPALHTVSIFGEPVFTYSYREAVIDGYLIDHEPPVQITTALSHAGIKFGKDEQIELIDSRTGKIDLALCPTKSASMSRSSTRASLLSPSIRRLRRNLRVTSTRIFRERR